MIINVMMLIVYYKGISNDQIILSVVFNRIYQFLFDIVSNKLA